MSGEDKAPPALEEQTQALITALEETRVQAAFAQQAQQAQKDDTAAPEPQGSQPGADSAAQRGRTAEPAAPPLGEGAQGEDNVESSTDAAQGDQGHEEVQGGKDAEEDGGIDGEESEGEAQEFSTL